MYETCTGIVKVVSLFEAASLVAVALAILVSFLSFRQEFRGLWTRQEAKRNSSGRIASECRRGVSTGSEMQCIVAYLVIDHTSSVCSMLIALSSLNYHLIHEINDLVRLVGQWTPGMKQNFTCESDSPLIAYTGAWAAQVGNVPASMNAYVTVSSEIFDGFTDSCALAPQLVFSLDGVEINVSTGSTALSYLTMK
jgi:hypothetical protein